MIKVLSVLQWYRSHFAGITEKQKVFILTSNSQTKKLYQDLTKASNVDPTCILDVNDFVVQNLNKFPELENFLGFVDEESGQNLDDAEMKSNEDCEEAIYDNHLELSELLLGIKEGRYFQGRFNVSRVTLEEGTVNA